MTWRRRLAVSLVALLTVSASFVFTSPRLPALAAEPNLEEAVAQQEALEQTLASQREQLDELSASRGSLELSLANAEAHLNSVAAEYDRVAAMLEDVRGQIAVMEDQLAALEEQIAQLDEQLAEVAADIETQTRELEAREALLEEHLRDAYQRSQTSLLEILLSAGSLDEVSTELGYLVTMAQRDGELADGIRDVRRELHIKQATLAEGRKQAAEAKRIADEQARELAMRQAELAELEAELERLRQEAEAARNAEAQALNDLLLDQEEAQRLYEANVAAHEAQEQLVARLQAEEQRRQQEAEEARRRERERAALDPSGSVYSGLGFRWPMDKFWITQEFGPTGVWLEPPAVYRGVYYPHFHEGIDMAWSPCGTPILAAAAGVVLASGRPNPASDGYGVIISHGGSLMTLYWHLTPDVVVYPGQQVSGGQVIGYEGNTGFSTGCHLHFALSDGGEWQNPRAYLP